VIAVRQMKNWMLWLLIALAILPMVIPVWRRYQVVRLRLTAAAWVWNLVPARSSLKKSRSPYLPTPRSTTALHLERRGISRTWFVLAIQLLIAIPLLTVLIGIVYHRIWIETFNPPYYSIRVRSGGVLHHVEFIMSPWHNLLMTIDGEVVYRL
jgi:hypothetical protein